MALQTSGAISLNDIHIEAGGSSGSQASINDSDIRGLISKASGATMSFNEWYGAASEVTLTSAGTVNGQAQRKEITVSNFISSGGTLIIPSNIWVWSDSVSTAALTIDVSCTIVNNGKIIGRGGDGINGIDYSYNGAVSGADAGPAIKINSGVTGVTITNASGAWIAGGGGSGHGTRSSTSGCGGSGGGAGGGRGGNADNGSTQYSGGYGGSLNASGGRGGNSGGYGGGAGGGGGNSPRGGGGGGRILPGTGGSGNLYAGNGGSANNAGTRGFYSNGYGGGGGGWGAQGGSYHFTGHYGGVGGAAIDDSGNTYTLSNSGTIYGST